MMLNPASKICFLVTIAALNLPAWAFGDAGELTSEKHTSGAAGMTLVDNGKPNAAIIVKEQATDLQLTPAKDLQEYILKITGALLPIHDDTERPKGNLILVGESEFTGEMGIEPSEFAGDSFIIKTAPERLVLAGHDDVLQAKGYTVKRGTANAVNAFLQDYCGVHWFMPGKLGEVFPSRKTIKIPEIDKRERLFRLYGVGSGRSAFYSGWGSRNYFGTSALLYHPGGHLWHTLIPQEKYFKDHPEWFALIGGRRTGEGNHLCTTNREMWGEALRNLKDIYAKGYQVVELGQSDGYQRCQCEKCEAMDEYRISGYYLPGTSVDRVWIFHNFLAEEIKKTYPDREMIIISYGPTGEVPHKIEKLSDNVIVEWCHPTPPLVERWGSFHDKFAVYLYWFTDERRNYLPVPYSYIASEFKRLVSAGAKGYFFCGIGSCWGTNAPIYYLIGQLLRDPERNEEEVMDEFCKGLFEAAASPMRSFFETLYHGAECAKRMAYDCEDKLLPRPEVMGEPYMRYKDIPLHEFYTKCFTDSVLDSCEENLKEAENLAEDEVVRRRIQFFRDGFDYVKLTTHAWACLRDYESDSSDKNLIALKDIVSRRNQFVEMMYERRESNSGDFPYVFEGTLQELLHGGTKGSEKLAELVGK